MRIYLDDDSAASLLIRLLQQAGHDSATPTDVGLAGEDDAVHLTEAVKDDRVLLTGNYRDFLNLHNLIMQARGHHPGILVVRRDNDPKRDLTPSGILRAIRNLLAANAALRDDFIILNHWR
jgi:predicted nuclease of predicted toxin-antitoxin system